MRTCPTCGEEFDDEIERCPADGHLLPEPITLVMYPSPEMVERAAVSGPDTDPNVPTAYAAERGPDTDPNEPASADAPLPDLAPWPLAASTEERAATDYVSAVFEAGTELGQYQVLDLLGKGGMGEVYLALHKVLDKRVAIKLLRSRFAANKAAVHRFFQEARAACKIEHPNVVAITDFVENDAGNCYYVMEYVPGTTLAPHVATRPLPRSAALAIACQIADALQALHGAGVAHLDLKPGNVMLVARASGPPLVKVLDFGLATLAEEMQPGRRGEPAQNAGGTPEYMSPEQIKNKDVGPSADIYALGVILYEMLSGQRPHSAPTVGKLLVSVVADLPQPLGPRVPDLPREVEAFVMRCLAKQPAARPNAKQALAELLALSEQLGSPSSRDRDLIALELGQGAQNAAPPPETIVLPPLEAPSRARRRWIIAISTIVALIGAVIAAFALRRDAPPPKTLPVGAGTTASSRPAKVPSPKAHPTIAQLSNRWLTVEHRSRDSESWRVAKIGLRLAHLDALRTGGGAKAEVTFDGGGKLEIGGHAEVLIERPRAAVAGGPRVINVTHLRRGEIRALTTAGRPLRLIGVDGSTTQIGALDGKAVRLRLRQRKKGLEVAVLSGRGTLRSGDQRVTLGEDQLVDVVSGKVGATTRLIRFPQLTTPIVDAKLRTGPVVLRWKRVPKAIGYRVRVDRTVGQERGVLDGVVNVPSLKVTPEAGQRYVWRVAAIDAQGHEGEFGFARRFELLSAARPRRPRAPTATLKLLSPPRGTRLEIGRHPELVVFRWTPARDDALLVIARSPTLSRRHVAKIAVQGDHGQLSLAKPGRYFWGLCPKGGCSARRRPLARPLRLTVVRRPPPKVQAPGMIKWKQGPGSK